MRNLFITVGLPGSGKTTFSKKLNKKDSYYHVDLDERMTAKLYGNSKFPIEDVIFDTTSRYNYYNTVIIDGLFLNEDDVKFVIKSLYKLPTDTIEIHYWKKDKEACIWNDKYRRSVDSEYTITNSELQKININNIIQYIKDTYNKTIKVILVEHTIVKKSELQMFIDKYYISVNEDGYMCSDSWSLGGEWWSYTGSRGTTQAEDQLDFTQFDNLLEEVCPNISFLQYKKIMARCCSIEDREIRDYYSNGREAYHACCIETLYDMLKELNLLSDLC